jgi:hypothetical protein
MKRIVLVGIDQHGERLYKIVEDQFRKTKIVNRKPEAKE